MPPISSSPASLPQPNRRLACAVVTSPYGESGGSLFAWETWVACQRADIAATFATLDSPHRYPSMGINVRRIKIPGGERFFGGEGLHNIVAEAREAGSILILDVRKDFGDDPRLKQLLTESGINTDSTIAALVPLMPGQPGTWGAGLGVGAFEKTGIYFDHGLFRYWDPDPDLVPPEFPDLPGFPFWVATTLSSRALSLIHSPAFSPIRKPERIPAKDISGVRHQPAATDAWVIREIDRHLAQATERIHQAVLEPLISSQA